ncbi:MAG TPA: GNAT family N-acetyltransferase [Candidatus Binataceae bacterium]|nr:GNAT family N-acetyltransferase [Candidatus Binataceae bacterium]
MAKNPTDAIEAQDLGEHRYLFYESHGLEPHDSLNLSPFYVASFWWAASGPMWPMGVAGLHIRARFAFRKLLDLTHLFAGRETGALCIHYGKRMVHYSGFTPRYWRFPFLADADLQIGDTWTDPNHRGKGLAGFALQQILRTMRAPGRRFWYVVGRENHASIRVAERLQFEPAAVGDWHKPWGIKLFGSYVPVSAMRSDIRLEGHHIESHPRLRSEALAGLSILEELGGAVAVGRANTDEKAAESGRREAVLPDGPDVGRAVVDQLGRAPRRTLVS